MPLSKKLVWVLGVCYFALSIFFAFTWAEERIAFGDAAYQLFSVLRTNDFAVQVMRFGSAITQFFPFIGSQLHLSLQTIVYLYSLSFELIALGAFLIVLGKYNNTKLAFGLLLTKTLITTHTFFWVQSELLQGIVILFVFLAWIKNKYINRFNILQYCIFFIFILLLVFVHPLILFPFLFSSTFLLLSKAEQYQNKTISTSAALFLTLFFLKSTVLKNAYDSGAMAGMQNFKLHFLHYVNTPSNQQFLKYCYTDYYLLPIVFLVLLLLLVYAKKWSVLILSFCFPIAYFLIVQISNYDGKEVEFRIESFYIPLAFMLSLVLAEELSSYAWGEKILYPLTALSIFLFLWRINTAAPIYNKQLAWNKSFVDIHRNEKLVIKENELSKHNIMLPWAFPYQSWIISTLHYNNTASFATVKEISDLDWAFYDKQIYLTTWGNFEYWKLPKSYFMFSNDSSVYQHYQP